MLLPIQLLLKHEEQVSVCNATCQHVLKYVEYITPMHVRGYTHSCLGVVHGQCFTLLAAQLHVSYCIVRLFAQVAVRGVMSCSAQL